MNRNVIPQENCIYIEPKSGAYPLIEARDAATSGDTIIVLPGSYTVPEREQLLKAGVNWHFMPGAEVTKTIDDLRYAGNAYGIFDDRATGDVDCSITGDGVFTFDCGQANDELEEANATMMGLVTITDADSKIHFEANKLRVAGFFVPADPLTGNVSAIRVNNTAGSYFDIDKIEDVNYGESVTISEAPIGSSTIGVAWRFGDVTIHVGLVKCSMIGFLADQTTGATGECELTVRADHIQQYFDYHCIQVLHGTLATWKTNFDVGTLRGEDNSNDIYAVTGGGTHFIRAKYVYSPTSTIAGANINASASASPTVVINYDYTSTPEYALIVGSVAQGSPIVSAKLDYVNQVTGGQVCYFERGECTVTGGIWKTTGAQAIRHLGGTARVKGVTIKSDGSDGATYYCANVSGSGLILEGCTLIAPASADSIYASSAQTVKVYGTTFTNKAKNANITIQAGLGNLKADANVT